MASPDKPQFSREEMQAAKVETACWLNEHFVRGSAWDKEAMAKIRSLPKPILFDLNNTLIGEHGFPFQANPLASSALDEAGRIGSIFLVTDISASRYRVVQEELQRLGLWCEGMVLMMRENYDPDRYPFKGKEELQANAQVATLEYVDMQAPKKTFRNSDFNGQWRLKRLASLFMKKYDVPIIDDYSGITNNNPGMLGIQVRDWTMGEAYYRAMYQDEIPIPDLHGAVLKVWEHYLIPLRDTLLPFSPYPGTILNPSQTTAFDAKVGTHLMSLRYHPDKIVRIQEGFMPVKDQHSILFTLGEYKVNRRELFKLRDLGVLIPDFDIVMGSSLTPDRVLYYAIVDKIDGENLALKQFDPEETEEASRKIDACFAGIAQYLWDVTKKSGWFISDLTAGKHSMSGVQQFIYGKRAGEEENQVYLVDIGPLLMRYSTDNLGTHRPFYGKVVPNLFQMIQEMESVLGSKKLVAARRTLLQFINSIPIDPDIDYYRRLLEVKSLLHLTCPKSDV